MPQIIVVLALVFAIIIAIFAVQNTTPVSVQFLMFHVDQMAVSVLVLISAALGAVVMLFLGLWREVRHRWRHRTLSQQLKSALARVADLEAARPQEKELVAGTAPPESTPPASS